jgi:hypothetical protein
MMMKKTKRKVEMHIEMKTLLLSPEEPMLTSIRALLLLLWLPQLRPRLPPQLLQELPLLRTAA